MLHHRSSGVLGTEGATGINKENEGLPSERTKTPRTGLKLSEGGPVTGKLSPAASPNSKKLRLSHEPGRPVAASAAKTGLRDITNSALKRKLPVGDASTDSISPRLLVETKKRTLPSLKSHPAAPPSKLQIMNTASELDFSSIPDSQLPDIEYAPIEPVVEGGRSEETDGSEDLEQFDFTFLTQPCAPIVVPLSTADVASKFTTEFESELSLLSIEGSHLDKAFLDGM